MSVTSNTDSVSTRGIARLQALFINRNFALLFSGQAISLLGDQIFIMLLIVWVAAQIALDQPWGPLATSGIMIASIVPTLLVGPLTGVFVDRWDRRRIMLWMDVIRAALLGSLFVLPFLQGHIAPLLLLIPIYIALFCENVCAQFFSPARLALIGDIVPEEKRPQATGMEQVSHAMAIILGPPIAAPLLFGVGAQWAILFNVFTFVLSFFLLRAIRLPPSTPRLEEQGETEQQHTGLRAEFIAGLRFAFGNGTIRVLVISVFLLTISVGSFTPLSAFFVLNNLHASALDTGILLSFFGGGAVLGAVLFAAFAQRIGIKRLFVFAIFMAGILFILFSRLNNFLVACVVILFIGLMQAALNVATAPILLKETPKNFIGRVSSVMGPIATLGALVSVTFAGYISGVLLSDLNLSLLGFTFRSVDTVFTLSGFIIVCTGIFATFSLLRAEKDAQSAYSA